MSTYYDISTRRTAQTVQADPRQVENHAGGYVFETGTAQTVRRFLILGTTDGTYYASPQDHTADAVDALRHALDEMGTGFVDLIVEVSDGGLAKSNTEALFALALASAAEDLEVRSAALAALPKVARTGTHLFEFVTFARQFRGLGRALKRAYSDWYLDRSVDSLANQLVKYQARMINGNRVSHKLVLGLTHPEPPTDAHSRAIAWAVGKADGPVGVRMIDGYQAAHAPDADVPAIVTEYRLPHEALPSEALTDPKVWEALLPHMGMTALIRNLGKLTSLGVTDSEIGRKAVTRLADRDELEAGRIHPMTVLFALSAYKQGRSRGKLTWVPKPRIVDALDAAFHLSFKNVAPTGKRRLIALDVSGSMTWDGIGNSPLTPREASAAMALVTLAAETEGDVDVMAFSTEFQQVAMSGRQRLDDAIRAVSGLRVGGTDCALPMRWAYKLGRVYDSFEIYTDNETYAGAVHPMQALKAYRDKFNPNARLVVTGMTATNFTIADPSDPGSMDVVGFDASAPAMISRFVAGEI